MRKKNLLRLILLTIPMILLCGFIPSIHHETASSVTLAAAVTDIPETEEPVFDLEEFYSHLPEYNDEPYAEVNNDVPLFTESEIESVKDVQYSELDELGRCSKAFGLIGPETIPEDKRGSIGDVRPTGWHTVRYDDRIEDRYLYNRCHLIGYQLAGANAEERNLITGTRYLNTSGMLPLENKVLAYITGTGNHVLYRVTPVFEEDNLVASGILMEAYSIEDKGEGIQFCRYLFNVQPGVMIDYKNGDSWEDSTYDIPEETQEIVIFIPEVKNNDSSVPDRSIPAETDQNENQITYVLNTNTKRFHDPLCPSVEDMKEKNREYSTASREELLELGYVPCGRCNP